MSDTNDNKQTEGIVAKRNIKDCVFTNMFGDKKYLMQMYKALHPEDDETTENELSIVTLENVLVNDLYNDLGFTVGEKLICLVEAQSTWTMNILIRVILYYAKTLKEYIDENSIDLYASTKASVPKPEFYVVYTGQRKSRPETINLSEEFFEGKLTGMDITVNMLYGEKDDIIGEYVTFTKIYNEQCKIHGRTEQAVRETIRICKDRNVLKEYLESREKEVIDMMVTLFDEEKIMKAHDKTVLEQGISQGIEQGIIALILDNLEDGKTEEVIISKLEKRFGLSKEDAEEYFGKYAN
ncbi:MAG: hypothetical protein II312_08690 [Lachnospiraceae bacterium]|nr:hypothetical protein [Lachnospiraceae bacterium]MBQ2406724.1 hypothetical protein [Lachnospiraceae bacterium]